MSLTFSTWQSSIANLASIPNGDANFQQMLPNCIDDAEQDMYRTLDLLNTVVNDSNKALSTGRHDFALPSTTGTFVVVQQFNVITPFGTTQPDLGTRNTLVPASKEMIDFLFPSSVGSGVPQYFAMVTQTVAYLGPWPDQAYQAEIIGTQRPQPLSSTNVTTLLSVYFPDLFVARSMVFVNAYMKNFGASVDDPQAGITWEKHYQTMLMSAQTEEQRKKFASESWSDKTPSASGMQRA